MGGKGTQEDIEVWLAEGYVTSFRTACLILGNRADAEEAVQEAFLRAWRFRTSLAPGSDVRPWLYRVVVNTCNSKLRSEIPHRDRRTGDGDLDRLAAAGDGPARRRTCRVTSSGPSSPCPCTSGWSSCSGTTPT